MKASSSLQQHLVVQGFISCGVPSVCKLVFFHEQHDMEDCSALSLAYLVVNLCRKSC
ncbi:hypothetical protein [Anaplasma phagocytophilum]|uniref:Putative lipoprotein n=3 Tax=Anaplasma phagocytophilum TaxID=948 RepID=Q2GKJ6_ANAPZ|nr:hypothetical protein [Anaplasma phagocytophilum]ABD43871.1 putative lipoprotein [Anaplasma phagocytophilum str. HZ]AGR79353.1 hypothetical protein YYU_02480 [Anaplasma phagocytophilum str. HZ2]AGR80599.1 hypothetical protein WSQ_02475 [Anaplasma phagocytophilum str. JM]AGR81858.1 hypothetical protein YYY_02500 [Anaplasma phagocytophilum str. Dog2]EOA60863.1 putative lipoprotein [Anaplasma phagocytophilum str. HGE1]